jgi:hypothetical protein
MQLNNNLIINESFRHDALHLFKNQFGTILNTLDYLQLASLTPEELEQLQLAKRHMINLHKSVVKFFAILTAREVIDNSKFKFDVIPLQQVIATGYFSVESFTMTQEILFYCNLKELTDCLTCLKELAELMTINEVNFTISVCENQLLIKCLSNWSDLNWDKLLNTQYQDIKDVNMQLYIYDFYLKAQLSGAKIAIEDNNPVMNYSLV